MVLSNNGRSGEQHLTHDLTTLLAFLRQSPQLEDLDLRGSFVPPHPSANDEPPVLLSQVKSLSLAGSACTYLALWKLIRIHPDARTAIIIQDVDDAFDISTIRTCLAGHTRRGRLVYDTLHLSALGLRGVGDGVPSLFLDLFDKSRTLYRPRAIHRTDPVVGLGGTGHPSIHIALLGVDNRFPLAADEPDEALDWTDTDIDPAPYSP